MSGDEVQHVGHDYVHVATIIVLAQVLPEKRHIQHRAGKAARLASWRKMIQLLNVESFNGETLNVESFIVESINPESFNIESFNSENHVTANHLTAKIFKSRIL